MQTRVPLPLLVTVLALILIWYKGQKGCTPPYSLLISLGLIIYPDRLEKMFVRQSNDIFNALIFSFYLKTDFVFEQELCTF